MARAYRKTSYFKDYLIAVIVLALCLLIFSVVKSVFSRETKSISPFQFSLGKINADGTVSDSETSLCTDYILCKSIKIKFNTERNADCWIFYYDANKKCVGNSGKLSSDYETSEFDTAAYVRVFLIPELKEGETKIREWEIFAYASAIDISIPKKTS